MYMEALPLKTKKQIVLSRIIYDYIINGLVDSLKDLSSMRFKKISFKTGSRFRTSKFLSNNDSKLFIAYGTLLKNCLPRQRIQESRW